MDVHDAINLAQETVATLFNKNTSSIRLEEVDMEDSSVFKITMSFIQKGNTETDNANGLLAIAAAMNANSRTYKIVKIRKSNGEVLSVKNVSN
ncbi:hypothetical protein ACJOWW_13065 [Acinetobacter baumannii]|uniref:hypothetical protein n=1 Tax=Acinetobacter baumannii TaxID=470 RepID=UPI0023415FC4|nr:hypothetical protein [Acinetobacter baumannii]MDC4353960.1 hypothetical protein [Acinetobacter baumannii]MDC4728824.1 hypothetical protein [Acinetobacter baumannii]MDC5061876.1 hypothetical protein [Acinetobacter baumannii]MDC5269648.1 hypothetical protein [Acinetobacter baumannii]MDP7806934.1 hypothetical protein [Acinetobacter baumannii]